MTLPWRINACHSFLGVAPIAGDSHHFVLRVPLRGTSRPSEIVLSILAPRTGLNEAIEILDMYSLVVFRVDRIPVPVIGLRIEKQHIMDSSMLFASLLGVAVGAGAFPNDLRPKVGGAEYGVH